MNFGEADTVGGMPTTASHRITELLETSTLDDSHGYLDLLGDEPPRRQTIALAAMRSNVLPIIYERWWRPVVRVLNGRGGPSQSGEQALARDLLGLHSGQTVLDVACGPGNFTRSFAGAVGPSGLAVGLDQSATMLAKAVSETNADQVGYVRGDAMRMPFLEGSFDAAGCFLALHLIPDPFRVVHEMVRMLKPGGRIAISAPCLPDGLVPTIADRVINAPLGIRTFRRDVFPKLFAECGLVDGEAQVTGVFQFAAARRPG
jgi:SAM-dependent methyltransferase